MSSHPGKNTVYKWVYGVKHNHDGYIERYKVRLRAISFCQWPSIDYAETFSRIIKFTTLHIALSLAISRD